MIEDRNYGLKADELGFLVGQRRLERINKDIHTDTQEIIRILTAMHDQRMANPPDNQLTGLPLAIAQANAQQTVDIVRSLRDVQRSVERVGARSGPSPLGVPTIDTQDLANQARQSNAGSTTLSTRPTVDVRSNADMPDRLASPAPTDTTTSSSTQNPTGPADNASGQDASPDAPSADVVGPRNRDRRGRFTRDGADSADGGSDAPNTDGRANNGRRRGADGRFEGNGQGGGDSAKQKTWFDRLRDAVSGGVSTGVDARGVDPTVDAINELGSVLSPVKKAAGLALKPMTALWRMRKRNEPLSREEREHNRRQIRALQDIARNQGGGGGMGGMLRMVRMIPIALIAAAPIIGAAIWDAMNGNLDKNRPPEQGDINPDGSSNTGVSGWINRKSKAVTNGVRSMANSANGLVGGDADYFDDGLGADSKTRNGLKTDAVNGGVNGGVDKVIRAGSGFNEVQMKDGSVLRKSGSRNWRNNNPGNLEYGAFAKKHGAVGSDGRFAIFPSYEAGRKAKERLIFENKKYKNLDLMGMVSKYAPPSENKTALYQKAVLSAVGENKRMSEYSDSERNIIMDSMERFEGFKSGKTTVIKPPSTVTESIKPSKPIDAKAIEPAITPMADTQALMQQIAPVTSMQGVLRQAIMPTALPSAAMSVRTAPVLPPMPQPVAFKERLGAKPPQIVTVAQSSDSIGQNVGDRAIAHAVSGGLGMRPWEG